MTVVNRSTSSLQQQIASSDMDRRTRAGRGAVSRIPAEADSGSLRAARSGPSPLLDPYPKTLGPAAPRRPGASPTGNIQLKCMSTGERDTSMVMAATGGGRRLPRSLMPTNVPRAEPQSERRRLDPMVDASMIDIVPQRILRRNADVHGSGERGNRAQRPDLFHKWGLLSRLLSPMVTPMQSRVCRPMMRWPKAQAANDGDVRPMRWGRSRR